MATKRTTAKPGSRKRGATQRKTHPAPWEQKNPKTGGQHTRLTPRAKAAAKRRAKAAGRTYPNLIDNMWAASQSRK